MSACGTLLKLSRYPVLAAVRPTADFGSFMGKTTRADRFPNAQTCKNYFGVKALRSGVRTHQIKTD